MDSFSKTLSSFFSSLFSSSENTNALGIDIGSESIKVVQLKKKRGKAVLETYGSIALGPYDDKDIGAVTNLPKEKIIQAIVQIMKEAGTTTKTAALSIQSSASLIFILELPPGIKEADMAGIIPNEARKYIPVPLTEVSLDWWVIPKQDFSDSESFDENPSFSGKKTEVLVVAIHNDSIVKYQDIIKDTALDSKFFEIEVFSSIRSLLDHELALVLLVDFGASKTKIALIEYGVVKAFHIINRGSADITSGISKTLNISFAQAEEIKKNYGLTEEQIDEAVYPVILASLEYIFNETNNVVLNYEKKYNKTVSKVILSGGGSRLKGLLAKASENFRVPVLLGEPFEKVEYPVFLSEVLKDIGPDFSIALGLALKRLE